MKKIVILLCSCFLLSACSNKVKSDATTNGENSDTVVVDMHNAENSLDYWGVYKGLLPCADCSGIETTLTLNQDSTFTLISVYLDKKDGTFEEKGRYAIEDNIVTLDLGGGETQFYKIKENQMVRLSPDKREITDSLAQNYILTKEE